MKKYIFFILTLFLSIGIYISDSIISFTDIRIIFLLIIFFLLIIIFNHLKKYSAVPFLIITTLLGFYIHNNQYDINDIDSNDKIHFLEIVKQQKISEDTISYIARNKKNNNLILLKILEKKNIYHPNDELIVYGNIKKALKPLNPYQFDFKQLLNRKNINYQLSTKEIISVHKVGTGFRNWSSKSKIKIIKNLKNNGYTKESRSIISSMLLGDKTELSSELKQSYIATGIIHILSISGLHVMMIFMILNFILRPLLKLKNGRKIRIIISLVFIWLFSFYVELEPPVFRSALMISIYYISELLNRSKNIYHTLSLSAFIILVYQPNYLFNIGFQLSFSAVFFIVWLNPIFDKIWLVKNKWLIKIKDSVNVSLSAQIGTLPISLYYFHQFTGLFILGNFILIPASFIMICGGIISIILLSLNINIPIYIWIFNQFIHWSNKYIYWLASLNFVARDVYISFFSATALAVLIYFLNPLFIKKSKYALWTVIACICLIEIDRSILAYHLNNSSELVVFNIYNNSIFSIRNGRNLSVFSKFPIEGKTYNYLIKPYKIGNRIKNISFYDYKSEFRHPNFIKHKNYIETKSFNFILNSVDSNLPYYALIYQSSIYNNPINGKLKGIIIDASNNNSIFNKIIKNNNPNIASWHTTENGYFSIKF